MSLWKFLGGLDLFRVLRKWFGNSTPSAFRNMAGGPLNGRVSPGVGVASSVFSANAYGSSDTTCGHGYIGGRKSEFEPHHINQTKDRMDCLMSEIDEYDESYIDELEDKIAELEDRISEFNPASRQYSQLEDELSQLQGRLDQIEDNCGVYGFPEDDLMKDDYSRDDFYCDSNSDSLPGCDFYDDPCSGFDDEW